MTLSLWYGIVIVLAALAATGYAIWYWGPGLRKHGVMCPMMRRHAHVLTEHRESEFGNLRVVDVKHCSLLNGAEVSCGKDCLKFL